MPRGPAGTGSRKGLTEIRLKNAVEGTGAVESNAESVRKFQPRVCFETLGSTSVNRRAFPGLPKRNPGLKLANALSVNIKLHQIRWEQLALDPFASGAST